MNKDLRKNIDLLIVQFWKRGYMTVSRRFGTYLPEPAKVGTFDVDIVARHKDDYAIGINLTESDFIDDKIISKLEYLATRRTKFTNRKVKLFVGVSNKYFKNAKRLLEHLELEVQKNIKLFQIVDKIFPAARRRKESNVLFS
ncbi:MAG: hypothetical protein JSW63_08240 [Ignavibacterium sp.]|nr:MAG: hypothetical protein JSW63_08240 [Ignavibacterium sp.]